MSNKRTGGGRPTAGSENRISGGGGGAGVVSINGNGNAAQTIVGAPQSGLVVSSVGGTTSLSQVLDAEWIIDRNRVYAVDGTLGNDANAGFADPAGNSPAQYSAACVAAGLVAKKTFAGLAAIFPRNGNGRMVTVLIKTGTYVGGIDTFLTGSNSFADGYPLVRGTGTNPTASSVAFAADGNDQIFLGAITATGMNAPGYHPTAAATTVSLPCTTLAGGAPGFTPGGLAVPMGWRIRFDNATTTALLRNFCTSVADITTIATLIPTQPFPAAPVATDTFYLEMAGVNCDAYTLDGINCASGNATAGFTTGRQIAGINCPGAKLNVTSGLASLNFCGAGTLSGASQIPSISAAITLNYFFFDPTNFIVTGGGLRVEGAALLGNVVANGNSFVVVGTLTLSTLQALTTSDGCAFKRILIQNSYLGIGTANPGVGNNFPAVIAPVFRGGAGTNGLVVDGSSVGIGLLDFQNCGASPCIKVNGASVLALSAIITGSVGNTDVGLDLTAARGARITLTNVPTVTGTAGDVRTANGQIVTWAQISRTGLIDTNGNRVNLAPANPLGKIQFTGAIFGAAGATVSYCANAGFANVVANEVTAFRRPTSMRFIQRMRVTNINNTSTKAVTVTLFKNGVATGLTVSIPAATAPNTQFSAAAPFVFFVDTDDMDVRMDDPALDAGGIVRISGALEYPI